MVTPLKIMWKTTTYGRVSTLEETLFSFINQDDLDNVEMIIVNDYPLQTLIFEHPKVKIFNIKEPFKTIGEKDNFAIEQSDAEIISTNDDDDYYLPNHNSNIRKYFVPGTDILHWKGIFYNEPEISGIVGIGNSGMVYSRNIWEKIGKHPIMNAGGDTEFSGRIHRGGYKVVNADPLDNEVSAYYMWGRNGKDGNGVYHQSGKGHDVEGEPSIIERHSNFIESLRRKGKIPTGDIVLNPHQQYDYKQKLIDYINKKNENIS